MGISREYYYRTNGRKELKFNKEELGIIGLWLADQNELEINDDVKKPVPSVKRKRNKTNSGSARGVIKRYISARAAREKINL